MNMPAIDTQDGYGRRIARMWWFGVAFFVLGAVVWVYLTSDGPRAPSDGFPYPVHSRGGSVYVGIGAYTLFVGPLVFAGAAWVTAVILQLRSYGAR